MEEIRMLKKAVRREALRIAAAMDADYCRWADAAIREAVFNLPAYRRARCIFCYVGTAREINTMPIIESALCEGKTVAVPLCVGKGEMQAKIIRSAGELRPGAYGILEPPAGNSELRAEEIGLALIPCLAGGIKGERLGFGGGFYDRYLIKTNCIKAMLCRGKMIRDDIPVEPHDLIMDMVICENGVFNAPSFRYADPHRINEISV